MEEETQRFVLLSQHLAVLDPALQKFCGINGFMLASNPFRQPGRDLRKSGNPHWLITLYLETDWRVADFTADTPHTVAVIGDYVPPEEPSTVWRRSEVVVESLPFSVLTSRIDSILRRAVTLLSEWSPEVIIASGQREENLGFKYREYFPGGDKWPDKQGAD